MPFASAHRIAQLLLLFVLAAFAPVGCQGDAQQSPATSRPAEGQPPAPATQTAATADPSRVSLLVFGDWGRNSRAEREVARAINAYARTPATRFDAGLLLGDNF